MNVTREEDGFIPITIVIETKQEAIAMWSALNAPEGDIIENCPESARFANIGRLSDDMWRRFNNVFKAEKE